MPDFIITIGGPNTPDNFKGSVNDLLEFIRANFTGTVTLNIPDSPSSPVEVSIGMVVIWPSVVTALPDKFLECKGQKLKRADYPELFAKLGETWNTDAGGDEFNLPDFRGRIPMGDGVGYAYPPDTSKGQLPEQSVGDYVGDQFPNNRIPQPNAPTYSGSKAAQFVGLGTTGTGIKRATSDAIGSIEQPAAVVKFIIRATV